MLDVDVEGVAFEEGFKVAVVLEDGVGGDLVEHAFECHAPAFDKVGLEAADGLFVRGWSDDGARAVVVETVVEPEEIAVAAGDGEGGCCVVVGARGGAGDDRVDCVRAGSIANGVGVADGDGEGGLRGHLDRLVGRSGFASVGMADTTCYWAA